MNPANETHDPKLASWLDSANTSETDFPIQNLPFGIFTRSGAVDISAHVGVAIGDSILDVEAAVTAGLLPATPGTVACRSTTLNALMALDAAERSALRSGVSELLRAGSDIGARARAVRDSILIPMNLAELRLPVAIGDYTDFYASIHHATNVGKMFRPDNPLLPNYKYVPIGYHGRASSIVVSGTPVHRPLGQTRSGEASEPQFGPSRMLDYEAELGFFVGRGNDLGKTIPIRDADDHIFGYCLVNDWSARDIQSWEYQPLGPFLAKNFATTVSPWVVTAEAVVPHRVPALTRPDGDPAPLEYLSSEENDREGGLDVTLEVYLSSPRMREENLLPMLLSRAPFSRMYWTPAQMLAHHASNGCNLRTGDLLASGTVSGSSRDEMGCLLELTRRGAEPIELPTGETRKFLEDGDEVIMRGEMGTGGQRRIGFGDCRGVILPPIPR
jgi:fumarylacetoacetase